MTQKHARANNFHHCCSYKKNLIMTDNFYMLCKWSLLFLLKESAKKLSLLQGAVQICAGQHPKTVILKEFSLFGQVTCLIVWPCVYYCYFHRDFSPAAADGQRLNHVRAHFLKRKLMNAHVLSNELFSSVQRARGAF